MRRPVVEEDEDERSGDAASGRRGVFGARWRRRFDDDGAQRLGGDGVGDGRASGSLPLPDPYWVGEEVRDGRRGGDGGEEIRRRALTPATVRTAGSGATMGLIPPIQSGAEEGRCGSREREAWESWGGEWGDR